MAEAIRLIVWDLDETFWRGTLTEGGIAWRDDTSAIVGELARRGIMSTICSKNDLEAARAVLVENNVWDCFTFPSIDWTPKGPRIRRLIETIQLRPESVLLIDDNPLNLEEAKFFSPGLQVAPETAIPSLLADPRLKGKDDADLTRLKHYKVLEAKRADEERWSATAEVGNLDFLRASDIRVRIESDIEAHLDRAIELINRTNQLNFVKRRLPEDIEAARRSLRAEIADYATQAGLIEVSDKYGDYGFCGYFQVTTRRDVAQLRQFCFSCRVLGMGVEAWVYQRIGRPALEVAGEVVSDPVEHAPVDWIRMISGAAAAKEGAGAPALGSVALRGGCVLWPLAHYFRMSSPNVVGEFNTVRGGKVILLDHSLCLRHAMLGVTVEQVAAVAPLGYREEDFRTEYFDHCGDKPLWVFSCWVDSGKPVFRHRRTGMTIPYQPARTDREVAAHDGLDAYLEEAFEPAPYQEPEFKETMDLIFSRIPSHGLMFVLKANETSRRPDGSIQLLRNRQSRNRWAAEAAAAYPNVRMLSILDFVGDEDEVMNARFTHFDRRVYHRLYLHITAEAKADLAGRRVRSTVARSKDSP